jgi:hypothetical protein
MFLTEGSQHARQSPQALPPCLGAGHVAPEVTTVDVFFQLPDAAWSIMGIENRITKLPGLRSWYFCVQASRVGSQ